MAKEFFKNDNNKYVTKESRTNIFNPSFNPTVSATGIKESDAFERNLDKYIDLVSYFKWNPDLFFDFITPKEGGGIKLDLDQRIYLRSVARFISFYGVFPRGYGKCESASTIIYTEDGMRELGEFFNYQNDGEETYNQTKIKLLNRYGELESTNAGVYSGYQPTKKIKTEEGYDVENTNNHPMLVISKDGLIDWKESKDIEVGDYVPISRKNDVWGEKTKLDINHNKLKDLEKDCLNSCNIIENLDSGFALIIGYLIGDGYLNREDYISFTSIDEDIIYNYVNFITNRLGIDISYKGIDCCVHSKYLREYFNQIGLKQVDAYNKIVPKCIMTAPKNIVASFIKGLFDVGGELSDSYIEYYTESARMSEQIQIILLNFGIVTTRTKEYNKKFNTYSYRICIYGKNIEIYKKHIGFSSKSKQEKIEELCNVISNPNKDIIPHQKDLVKKYYNDIKKYNTCVYDKVCNILNGNNELTYETIEYLMSLENAELCEGYDKLKELMDLQYFYSRVSNIEDSNNHVYDLSLPKTHSFISNGFISHNTFLEVLGLYHTAIFYPDIELSMTAQTRENASKIIEEKHREILRFYPLLGDEIIKATFSKDTVEIKFVSGAVITILANHPSSKGARRKRLMIEESALLNNELFESVLEPIVNVPRRTIGKASLVNPEELNGQICFFTTSGFRGSSEFARSLRMVDAMADLRGMMVCGSDWQLAEMYGRGETKSQILEKKAKLSPINFDQNYCSKWTGNTDSQLVDINKLMDTRNLEHPEFKNDDKYEYILGVDVARSQDKSNNQTSIAVVRLKKSKNGKLKEASLVNLINVSNALNFTAQAVEVKKAKNAYNAKVILIDTNGLGVGLCDKLLEDTIDPDTGKSLGCYDTINTEQEAEEDGAEKIVYDLKPQSANHDVIIAFIDMVESGKLRLLEKKDVREDMGSKNAYLKNLPYINTDFLIEEIANLKLKQLSSGKYTVEKVIRKYDKDRYSALAYALWYIKKFEDNIEIVDKDSDDELLKYLIL